MPNYFPTLAMASGSAGELLLPLKYQTWVLKVPMHCEACKRRVKKLLHSIDGVYTTAIDLVLQKVTVTGNVEAETLVKRLLKAGKHAELWPENIAGKEKKLAKRENEEKNEPKCSAIIPTKENENPTKDSEEKCSGPTSENVPSGEISPAATDHSSGHGGKKNKRKGQKGNKPSEGSSSTFDQAQVINTADLSPPRHHFVPYELPNPVYMASYNVANPTKMWSPTYYYIASSPYTYAYVQPMAQSAPLDPFQIFSEDNPSGCNIM